MKPKISVILATNRLNEKVLPYMKKFEEGLKIEKDKVFNDEFLELARWRVSNSSHFLQPTLECLAHQKFEDFELVISHKYPEDAKDLCEEYGELFKIKLVKEKHSIWHDLGPQYHTVANNKNTGFINSSGELIYHIDDLTFFNDNLLQEVWDLYKDGKYMTGRTIRCITYDKEKWKGKDNVRIGPNKTRLVDNGWKGELKPLVDSLNHPEIPMSMFWTCSASVSAEELLEINGYDELYDGSLAGIDMDAGTRLEMISKYKRVASDAYLYEIDDPTPKNMIRDDVMMRKIFKVSSIKANSWKPRQNQIDRYKMWHEDRLGKLDINWDKFILVPLYKMERV
jgi:hypothetical protein